MKAATALPVAMAGLALACSDGARLEPSDGGQDAAAAEHQDAMSSNSDGNVDGVDGLGATVASSSGGPGGSSGSSCDPANPVCGSFSEGLTCPSDGGSAGDARMCASPPPQGFIVSDGGFAIGCRIVENDQPACINGACSTPTYSCAGPDGHWEVSWYVWP